MLDYMPVSVRVQEKVVGWRVVLVSTLISMYIKTKYIDTWPSKINNIVKHNDTYSIISFELK